MLFPTGNEFSQPDILPRSSWEWRAKNNCWKGTRGEICGDAACTTVQGCGKKSVETLSGVDGADMALQVAEKGQVPIRKASRDLPVFLGIVPALLQ